MDPGSPKKPVGLAYITWGFWPGARTLNLRKDSGKLQAPTSQVLECDLHLMELPCGSK